MTINANIIRARDLKIKRGSFVLDIPDLDMQSHDSVAVIGPNGCGKTTLLLAMLFLVKHASGTIAFNGKAVSGRKDVLEYRKQCAFVFQDPLLFNTSVYDNVAYPLKVRGRTKREIKESVRESLERFNLSHLEKRSAKKLSGGEAQRVNLARAFASQPRVIFLDEPFASIDAPSREALISDFKKNFKDTGAAAMFITHDKDEVLSISNKVIVMENGTIAQQGLSAEVLGAPVNEFTASFAGIESLVEGTVAESRVGTVIVRVRADGKKIAAVSDALKGERVILCIKPENVSLSSSKTQTQSSVRNTFPAHVADISAHALYYKINIDCGFRVISYITHESMKKLKLKAGSDVFVSFKATSVHLIRK